MIDIPAHVQPLFEHRAEFAGYETRVLELEGGGPPLLLLHGYADSADTWRLVLDQLARAGQRAVAIDLPGFGHADPLVVGPILPQLDQVVEAGIRYAGGRPRRPVVVVGNSLGGCLAMRAGERQADKVAAVMAAAPAGADMGRLIYLVEHDPVLHTLLGLPTPIPSAVIRAAVARLYVQLAFASPRGIDPQVISNFASYVSHRARAASYLDIGHRLVPELRSALSLGQMHRPLLLLWGERDRMLSVTGARRICEALPDARLELLEGIGHCPQVEVPERFAELLLAFAAEYDED
jgi:pimeloyl-ACP methyl ester carboxylesterase